MVFPVVMYECELDCEESSAPKNLCFWTVVLEKTLESPLDCKEIQPVHPKGDQSWVFIGRTDAEAETNILATSCEDLTHWKRPWCWEGLGAGGERDDRGWDGWVASQTWWTWVLVNSRSLWWTGRPGMLRFMGSQRVGHDWVTELNWMTKDVEHLYLCLSSIHLCFWNICLNTLLLLNWAICLLIINLQSSFYILNTNLLSRICFSNALSQSKPCISFGNNNIWRTIYFYLNEADLMVHYFVFIV